MKVISQVSKTQNYHFDRYMLLWKISGMNKAEVEYLL